MKAEEPANLALVAAPAAPAAAGIAEATEAKPKKKRNWPSCSIEGCGKKMYPGSGKNRLCYGHHLDAGGKQSPLLATRVSKAAATATDTTKAAKVPMAAKKPKTTKLKPPKAARAVGASAATDPKPEKKKKPWPTCSVDGCGKNVYMPSGARKMCYQHNLEHGGKPTPLAKVNKARKKKDKTLGVAATEVQAAEKKPKTVRRGKEKAKK